MCKTLTAPFQANKQTSFWKKDKREMTKMKLQLLLIFEQEKDI